MKKIEAQNIAKEKSKLIINYLSDILSRPNKIEGLMNFSTRKIDNQSMNVLDVYIPTLNIDEHWNLEITSDHSLVLYEQLLNDLLDNFMDHETLGVTKHSWYKSMNENFSGIGAINIIDSCIRINFGTTSQEFMELISKYHERIDEFTISIEQQNNRR